MSRLRYLAKRTVYTVILLWLVITFLFFLFRAIPGSYLSLMRYQGASPEAIAFIKQKWGLGQPLYIQYWRYMVNLIQLDVGQSLQFRVPVVQYVQMKIFNSFILIAPAITLAYLVGSVLGVVFGSRRGSKLEKVGVSTVVFQSAFPTFFTSIIFVIVFASWLNLFPTGGLYSTTTLFKYVDAPWWRPYLTVDFLMHYILPFSVIVVRYLDYPALIMRTSVVEVMGQEFTYYHRMTGLPERKRLRHLAKHASLPVITLYPVAMTRAIGGLVLVEVVFNWPGIGSALINAVLSLDYPVVQFVFFLIAAFVIIANFVVDIVYGFIDPRVTVGE